MATIDLLAPNKRQLDAACTQHRVRSLEVFGSAAVNKANAESDIDFLVDFLPMPAGDHAEAYLSLLETLQELFGRPVDLIELKAIDNPYFLKRVNESRKLVYAA